MLKLLLSPRPVPLPISLVVKNGFMILSRIEVGIPKPLSEIKTSTHSLRSLALIRSDSKEPGLADSRYKEALDQLRRLP